MTTITDGNSHAATYTIDGSRTTKITDPLGHAISSVWDGHDNLTKRIDALSNIEDLLWPDLIVVGGGVSRKADKFLPLLHLWTPIVAAQLANSAGIIGAAWLACND